MLTFSGGQPVVAYNMATGAAVEDLQKTLNAMADGAPAGDMTAKQLRALAAAAEKAAARLDADEARRRPPAAPAPAPTPAPAAARAAGSDSDSDAGLPEEIDEAFVAERKAAAAAAFKAKDYKSASAEWSKAAKHLKRGQRPDAKLLSNLAAAQLALDKFVAAGHNAAESVDADPTWWKGHWYRGQALYKMARNKPPSMAMSERLEQAIAAFKACRAAATLPEAKREEVEKELQVAKDYSLKMNTACQQQ